MRNVHWTWRRLILNTYSLWDEKYNSFDETHSFFLIMLHTHLSTNKNVILFKAQLFLQFQYILERFFLTFNLIFNWFSNNLTHFWIHWMYFFNFYILYCNQYALFYIFEFLQNFTRHIIFYSNFCILQMNILYSMYIYV